MQSTTATFDEITEFMSNADMDDVVDLEKEMDALIEESDESPTETVEKAVRSLENIDQGMLQMFGDKEQIDQATDKLKDLLALMKYGEEEAVAVALRSSFQGKADAVQKERHPTWELIYPSETQDGKDYLVTWDVGSEWNPSARTLKYGCTCKSYKYAATGPYCKHIESVIEQYGGGGEMPPPATHTGFAVIVHDSKYEADYVPSDDVDEVAAEQP